MQVLIEIYFDLFFNPMEIKDKIELIAQENFNGNNVNFANRLGTSEANIRNYRSGKAVPKLDFIIKLNRILEINFDWLLAVDDTDKPMISHQSINVYATKADGNKSVQTIPLYDVPAAATLTSVFAGKQNIIDHLSIPNLPKCDGALTVTGDSMYPLVKSGDIVAYKQQPVEFESIIFGEMYLLSYIDHGESYIMVKYIQRSEKGIEYVKLVSQNQHHQSRDISLKKVKALALIKATVRIHSMY